MDAQVIDTLRVLGEGLDQNQFPDVYNGGLVRPSEAPFIVLNMGKEKKHAKSRQTRSTTRSRQGTTRKQRQTHGSRSSGNSAPVFGASLQERYETDLNAVRESYPDSSFWFRKDGMWLLINSAVLSGIKKTATFLIFAPFTPEVRVHAWGFWTTLGSCEWIGPRHTNFPDGSVCAFEPRDRTWTSGDSLVDLIDLYTLWALRHLHLEVWHRWPGYQSVPLAYERLRELQDDEFCGCNKSHKRYEDCCKRNGLRQDKNALEKEFLSKVPNYGLRRPPVDIVRFVRDKNWGEAPSNLVELIN